jgi:2-polyprenyl-3-methyl-5-hydroxy-6-metoxy-1,4-benzoquinol methylase
MYNKLGLLETMSKTDNKDYCISPYYDGFRNDVLAAIPPDAKTVLSVGCAGGRTEAELVKRGVKVVGIEMNPDAAKMARGRGVTILEGDATRIDVNIGYEPYDCIIYADILEHLLDPVSVLKRHVQSLKVSGIVYITIPNFRHYSIFWELFVRGHIIYKDAGILDRTHLRITTRRTVLDWFDKAGLTLVRCDYIFWGRKSRLISACLFGLAREFLAAQIGIVARKQ